MKHWITFAGCLFTSTMAAQTRSNLLENGNFNPTVPLSNTIGQVVVQDKDLSPWFISATPSASITNPSSASSGLVWAGIADSSNGSGYSILFSSSSSVPAFAMNQIVNSSSDGGNIIYTISMSVSKNYSPGTGNCVLGTRKLQVFVNGNAVGSSAFDPETRPTAGIKDWSTYSVNFTLPDSSSSASSFIVGIFSPPTTGNTSCPLLVGNAVLTSSAYVIGSGGGGNTGSGSSSSSSWTVSHWVILVAASVSSLIVLLCIGLSIYVAMRYNNDKRLELKRYMRKYAVMEEAAITAKNKEISFADRDGDHNDDTAILQDFKLKITSSMESLIEVVVLPGASKKEDVDSNESAKSGSDHLSSAVPLENKSTAVPDRDRLIEQGNIIPNWTKGFTILSNSSTGSDSAVVVVVEEDQHHSVTSLSASSPTLPRHPSSASSSSMRQPAETGIVLEGKLSIRHQPPPPLAVVSVSITQLRPFHQ